MTKQDEREKIIYSKSLAIPFIFLLTFTFIYDVIEYVNKGVLHITVIFCLMSLVLYLTSIFYLRKKY